MLYNKTIVKCEKLIHVQHHASVEICIVKGEEAKYWEEFLAKINKLERKKQTWHVMDTGNPLEDAGLKYSEGFLL